MADFIPTTIQEVNQDARATEYGFFIKKGFPITFDSTAIDANGNPVTFKYVGSLVGSGAGNIVIRGVDGKPYVAPLPEGAIRNYVGTAILTSATINGTLYSTTVGASFLQWYGGV